MRFGKEVSATGEVFQIEELIFFEAVDGFDIALVGVRGGRDARVLTGSERSRKARAPALGVIAAGMNSAPLSVCQARSRSETP